MKLQTKLTLCQWTTTILLFGLVVVPFIVAGWVQETYTACSAHLPSAMAALTTMTFVVVLLLISNKWQELIREDAADHIAKFEAHKQEKGEPE